MLSQCVLVASAQPLDEVQAVGVPAVQRQVPLSPSPRGRPRRDGRWAGAARCATPPCAGCRTRRTSRASRWRQDLADVVAVPDQRRQLGRGAHLVMTQLVFEVASASVCRPATICPSMVRNSTRSTTSRRPSRCRYGGLVTHVHDLLVHVGLDHLDSLCHGHSLRNPHRVSALSRRAAWSFTMARCPRTGPATAIPARRH
jgi:hypothetical protein